MPTTNNERLRKRRRRRRGTAATEFVVALPLLITLCLTSVDFGRFAYDYISLGNACRVGCEVGATRSRSSANDAVWRQQVDSAIREDFAAASGLDPGSLVINLSTTADSYDLERVTLTMSYPFNTVVSWPSIPRPLLMERKVVFRRFR